MKVTGCSAHVDKDVVYYLNAALYYIGPVMAAALVFTAIVASRPAIRRSGWRYLGASFGAIATLVAAGLVSVPVLFIQAAMAGCFQ